MTAWSFEALERLSVMARDQAPSVAFTTVVREGSPANQILAVAQEVSPDVIVMASHTPGISNYIMGSVAGKVVRYSSVSVLVVRPKPEIDVTDT
ncbi:MAG: universal stress protein [Hyphomicrobiales bacterium]